MKQSVLLRHQLLIDRTVQVALLWRTALYSGACAVYFIVILVCTESLSDPDEPLLDALLRCIDDAIYWAPGLMLLVPVMAYDLLRMTNRFAGPVFRLRREMQRLLDEESEYPLSFRDGDYWAELADIFNELRAELHELREEKKSFARRARRNEEIAPQNQLFVESDGDEEADNFLVGTAN